MKKLIAFLLTLILLTGCIAAAFTDAAKINPDFTDAVTAMSEKGIIGGFPDGSFKPADTLTRAQAAKIICTMLLGADKADAVSATASFTDVPASHWATKFIGYCADKGIVAGVGGGKFSPDGKLTGAAFAKMLLVAYGHNAETEHFVGATWMENVQRALRMEGLNYKVGASDSPMKREEACQMAYNFVRSDEIARVEGYAEKTIKFTESNVKLLGRAEMTDKGVVTNYSGDGVEFTVDCKGTLECTFVSQGSGNLIMTVDGQDWLPRMNASGSGTGTGARFVEPGVHTIRVLQDSEVNTSGKRLTLISFHAQCKEETFAATKANPLYIEFLGDSVTAGCCVAGQPGSLYHAGSQSYAYFTANKMGADYAMVAKGSQGFTEKKWQKGASVDDMFLYQNPWINKTDKAVRARTPDIFVCAMGQNDPETEGDTEFHDNLTAFVKLARQTLGAKTKIVMIYGLMTSKHAGTPEKVCEELGGAAKGYYAFRMPTGNGGASSNGTSTPHPGRSDNEKSSDALAAFLKTIV